MKNIILLFLLFLICMQCQKTEVSINDLIDSIAILPSTSLLADGTSTDSVKVFFNKNADLTKCIVNVTIDNGVFPENNTQSLTNAAVQDTQGNFVSKFIVKSPTKAQDITIQFEIAQYTTTRIIHVQKSEPQTISITADSFSVETNFGGELKLMGTLKNSAGGMVSEGVNVQFEDTYMDNTPVKGLFRQAQLVSNSLSQVSVIYSPATASPNQYIYLKAIMLNDSGSPIGKDSLKIFLK